MPRRLISLLILLASQMPSAAADLANVDRSIAKEPRYVGKPEYCLMVFGADIRDRLWMVRDGDTLYADKNGNGDLTDAGEKIAAEADGLFLTFHVGMIRRGQLEHRNLTVRASKLSLYGADYTDHPVAKAALT